MDGGSHGAHLHFSILGPPQGTLLPLHHEN